MIYGYVRPLYDDKTCERQIELLSNRCDTIYDEAHGKPKKRMKLEELLMALKPGDIIVVERMFVLADTIRHLDEIVSVCERDEVSIHFLQEDIYSDKVFSRSLQDMLKHFIQLQTDLAKQSAENGIIDAKGRGKAIGRPKKPDVNIQKAVSMYHSGDYTLHDIKSETNISKSTLYRYLEMLED